MGRSLVLKAYHPQLEWFQGFSLVSGGLSCSYGFSPGCFSKRLGDFSNLEDGLLCDVLCPPGYICPVFWHSLPVLIPFLDASHCIRVHNGTERMDEVLVKVLVVFLDLESCSCRSPWNSDHSSSTSQVLGPVSCFCGAVVEPRATFYQLSYSLSPRYRLVTLEYGGLVTWCGF